MKKTIAVICCVTALTFVAQADDKDPKAKKHAPSPELKALIAKYDTNKDGKLDKEERAKLTPDDKAKLKELRAPHKKGAAEHKDAQ